MFIYAKTTEKTGDFFYDRQADIGIRIIHTGNLIGCIN